MPEFTIRLSQADAAVLAYVAEERTRQTQAWPRPEGTTAPAALTAEDVATETVQMLIAANRPTLQTLSRLLEDLSAEQRLAFVQQQSSKAFASYLTAEGEKDA